MLFSMFAYGILIYPLRFLTPILTTIFIVCFLDYIFVLNIITYNLPMQCVFIYSFIEVCFYFWYWRAYRLAQVRNIPKVLITKERRMYLKEYMKNYSLRNEKPFQFLNDWFYPLSIDTISKADTTKWLAWALFDKHQDELTSSDLVEIEEMLIDIENSNKMSFRVESAIKDVHIARLNIDPVRSHHRPLIYYTVTGGIDYGSDCILNQKGFERYNIGIVNYWVLQPQKLNKDQSPLVFIHGVGIGLVTYLPFLLKLCASHQNRQIMLLELPHVSMKLCLHPDDVPTMTELAVTIKEAMKIHDFKPAYWIAHSLGTFVFAVINRIAPELITNVLLIDPVCFLLWEFTITNNFCYRMPTDAMQFVMYYHVCKELTICNYFHRYFYWHECILLAEDLPKNTIIYTSEKDDIYNVGRVLEYLSRYTDDSDKHIQLRVFKDVGHGAWILDNKNTQELLDAIE